MTTSPAPDMVLSLTWQGGEIFAGESRGATITVDGKGQAGPSPVQTLAFSLGACMGIDVADVIVKGRYELRALTCRVEVFRAKETPRRIIGVAIHYEILGRVPDDRVERAIALSRDKYCSVWHSLNPDIDFKTNFTVTP
jgi:putative redox protein